MEILGHPLSVGYERRPNSRPRESGPEERMRLPPSPRRVQTDNSEVEGENSAELEPEEKPDGQQNARQRGKISSSNSMTLGVKRDEFRSNNHREAKPTCEGSHI